jgi:murein DD-endopeptidase MepM/ murein hydrolase activator NlpD
MLSRTFTSRLLGALTLALLSFFGIAGQNDSYPFSIENEKTPNGHRLVARNSGPAPVSVKVSIIDAQNITTDRQFPLYVVVPPGGSTLYLGNIRSAMEGNGYAFHTQYTWTLGDMNASQAPDALYRLPYRDGSTFRIGQSPGGPITTHSQPDSQFAVDIPMPEGTPVLASRSGTVIYTEANQVYGAQVPDMLGKANEVKIQHIDGTIAIYAHLAHGGVYVYSGQRVEMGQQIGLAGSTGYSSGPHLHFAVQTVQRNGDKIETISLPFQFYVGNPAVAFSPQFGMLATAYYTRPGSRPGMEPPVQVARDTQPMTVTSPSITGVTVTIHPNVLSLYEKLKLRADDLAGYAWYLAIVGLLLLILNKNRQAAKQRQRTRSLREPTLGQGP